MKNLNQKNSNYGFASRKGFVAINFISERNEIVFNMDLLGINSIIEICKKVVVEKNKVQLTSGDYLTLQPIKNFVAIKNLFLIYNTQTNQLTLNYCKKDQNLFVFGNNESFIYLIDTLNCLKESLEEGNTDDISYMSTDWGGEELIVKKIIENSSVIHHLRLYGIF